jgi:hypothetical protein
MNSDGFHLGHLDDDVIHMLLDNTPSTGWVNIFNGKTGKAGKRLQCTVDSAGSGSTVYADIWKQIQAKQSGLTLYEYRNTQYLHSESGCLAQETHTDFNCAGGLSVIVALQDNTTLSVCPLNSSTDVLIRLSRGDFIVFDGLLKHAGSAYTRDNLRLHMYCSLPGVQAPQDQTFIV